MSKQLISQKNFSKKDTKNLYDLNKLYNDYVFQKIYYPYYFDGLQEKKFYGIIDKKNNIVYPKESSLKLHNNSTQRNINFVVDAFNDFKSYYKNLIKNSKISDDSLYTSIDIINSTTTFYESYDKYIIECVKLFENNFLTDEEKSKMFSYDTFILYLIRYIKALCSGAVINRSSYIKSRFTEPAINGLRISINSAAAYIDYIQKANKFVTNPNFDFFVESAGRFGFFVDKHQPWTIVADIESPVMRQYMRFYDILETQDMFDKYYHNAYMADLDSLKNVIIIMWNKYAQYKTNLNSINIKKCKSFLQETSSLQQITPEKFNTVFGNGWLIRFYLFTRILEEKININQSKFESLFEESIKINNFYDSEKAILYINNKVQEIKAVQNNNLTSSDEIIKVMASLSISKFYEDLIF